MTGRNGLSRMNRQFLEVNSQTHEHLLGLRASVHPDGGETSFSIGFTNQKPFKVLVGLDEIASILHEIRYASNLMVDRQRLHVDRGAGGLLEICQGALQPDNVEVLIDPLTGDGLFVHQFREHAPLAVRLAMVDVKLVIAKLGDAVRRSQN